MPIFQTRLTPDLVERYTRSGHWGAETFYQILQQRAAAHPDREAIIDYRQRVTYGELRARVDRTAAALQALGIGPDDVVTIQLPNWAEFAYVFFACERLGAVANQIGPDFRSREVEYILRFSESRAFVCPGTVRGFEYVPMIHALRRHLPALRVGARAVLLDRFNARAALELMERERVTFIPSAPASLIAMLNDPALGRFDLSALRVVITGGASCPVDTLHAFRARMPGHL